jgi:hypothetical protein
MHDSSITSGSIHMHEGGLLAFPNHILSFLPLAGQKPGIAFATMYGYKVLNRTTLDKCCPSVEASGTSFIRREAGEEGPIMKLSCSLSTQLRTSSLQY